MQVITVQSINDRPILAEVAANDFLLIGDASDGNTIKRVALSTLRAFVLAGLAPTPTPTPTPNGFALRINCGGAEYTDSFGKVWSAEIYRVSGGSYTSNSNIPINSPDPVLYESQSYSFEYSIPLENGFYTVNLGFVEVDESYRVFSITLNGTAALTDYEIAADVGLGNPTVKSFTCEITNGILIIASSASSGNSLVCAIEILRN